MSEVPVNDVIRENGGPDAVHSETAKKSKNGDDGWRSVNYDREQEEKHFSRIIRAFKNYR